MRQKHALMTEVNNICLESGRVSSPACSATHGFPGILTVWLKEGTEQQHDVIQDKVLRSSASR